MNATPLNADLPEISSTGAGSGTSPPDTVTPSSSNAAQDGGGADTDRYRCGLDFLFGRLNYERVPDRARTLDDFHLARMETLLERLGNPQLQVPTIHVAGSKGKGSTATMIAGILRAAGCRVGLFTSPHQTRYEERFLVDGSCPTREMMADLMERLCPVAEEMDLTWSDGSGSVSGGGPTFFELTAALGWLHFLASDVDVAVVEVGLGGRLDATNVCAPLVTVITSISRDHMRLLGDTEEEIAAEKAGIIKPGIPVVSGVTAPGPAAVIEAIALQSAAPLYRLVEGTVSNRTGTDSTAGFCVRLAPPGSPPFSEPPRYRVDVETPLGSLHELEPAMPGEHQARNAAVAIMACQLVSKHRRTIETPGDGRRQPEGMSTGGCRPAPASPSGFSLRSTAAVASDSERRSSAGLARLPEITESHFRTGLAAARCPLRVEVLSRDPLTVVDAAHNPASIEALCRTLHDVAARKRWAVFSSSRDKETATLLGLVGRNFDEVVLTQYSNNPRALTGDELETMAREVLHVPWRFVAPPEAALQCVQESAAVDDLVCVTGSFFLAAEVRDLLRAPGSTERPLH